MIGHGEIVTIGGRIDRAAVRRLRSISRAERNRLARGRPARSLSARQQEAVDRAAGMPRGISAGVVYRVAQIDENRITLS